MKILRSVNRRGFSVGTAGWFTVLKPNTWFAASRFQNSSLSSRFRGGLEPHVKNPTTPSLNVRLSGDRVWTRVALVILGAMAITSALLWWIMHP